MNSKRKFFVVLLIQDGEKRIFTNYTEEVSIDPIFQPAENGSDAEYLYSLNEKHLDDVLDMMPQDHLIFQANRDIKGSKGLLIRLE